MTFSRNAPALLALDVLGLAEIEPRGVAIFPIRFDSGREGARSGLIPAPVSACCIVAEKEKHRDGHGWQ